MRALPIERIPAAPTAVLGAAVVRGAAVPVVDCAALFDTKATGREMSPARYFVRVRVGSRTAALAVDEVAGVRALPAELDALPPLFSSSGLVRALAAVDDALAVVLEAARLVPDDVWAAMEARPRA